MRKLSESVWTDIQKRSNGDRIRKENDHTNIMDIIPLDMDCSVLWADRDLEWKDGSCYFNFDEVSEIVEKSKWRIPTKNEVSELFNETRNIKNTDDICILVKKEDYELSNYDNVLQMSFDKKGYVPGDSGYVYSQHNNKH